MRTFPKENVGGKTRLWENVEISISQGVKCQSLLYCFCTQKGVCLHNSRIAKISENMNTKEVARSPNFPKLYKNDYLPTAKYATPQKEDFCKKDVIFPSTTIPVSNKLKYYQNNTVLLFITFTCCLAQHTMQCTNSKNKVYLVN